MNITLSKEARERSGYTVTVSFTDKNGNAVTPSAVNWSLLNIDDEIVNSRENVEISTGESVDIILSGDDLITGRKTLLVIANIDGVDEYEECYFNVKDLHGVS